MKAKKLPGWLDLLLIGGTFAGLLWLERRRPLRRAVEPKLRREGRNLAVAALSEFHGNPSPNRIIARSKVFNYIRVLANVVVERNLHVDLLGRNAAMFDCVRLVNKLHGKNLLRGSVQRLRFSDAVCLLCEQVTFAWR